MQEPKTISFDDFADELMTERQPRALVILACARIDIQLRALIEAFLFEKASKKQDPDELLDGENPIGNFSSRIKICRRMGLIDPKIADALHKLRDIRNKAAHWVSFVIQDPSLRDRLKRLRLLVQSRKSYALTVSKFYMRSDLNEFESLQAVLLTLSAVLEALLVQVPENSLKKIKKTIEID